jgi:hypothetical protein
VNQEARLSSRLLYLLGSQHAPPCACDWILSLIAGARMAARRRPRWERNALVMAR